MTHHFGKVLATAIFALCAFFSPVSAAEAAKTGGARPDDGKTLTYTDAVVLGGVEGLTEYLPVSSTGHLILADRVLGLDDAGKNAKNAPKSEKARAVDAYSIVIQIGAIAAVAILYWQDILSILYGFLGRDKNGLRLGINLIVAFIPAAIFGFLLNNWIESKLFGPIPVAIALALGAPLMIGVEKWRRKKLAQPGAALIPEKELCEITPVEAVSVGLLQCVAMWPGTSRSMMTITGGYLIGLAPAKAARFSFLLGLVTLSAATGFTILKQGREMAEVLQPGPVLVGLVVAMITAALSVKWLVGFLSRKGLAPFAYYRIIVAIAILTIIFI
jgi:undecaprenyl-diphosphatase